MEEVGVRSGGTFIADNVLGVNFLGGEGVIFLGAVFKGRFSERGTFIGGCFNRGQFS